MLEKIFHLKANGTNTGREIVAGLTTFAAMAYILAVNPGILAEAGMPQPALVTATALSAALATVLMACLTNFPLALAPGMGINAFFAFTLCKEMGIAWQSALGLVFINGCIFLLLSVTGVRRKILHAIPVALKLAVAAGIGLFIAFIGLQNGGLIVSNSATLVGLGDLTAPSVALFACGTLLACALTARRVPGGLILSMAAITVAGLFIPQSVGGMITQWPGHLVSLPASLEPLFFKLNFDLLFQDHWKALPIILTLLLVDLFDNLGTLIGVARRAGLMDKEGNIPKVERALLADSGAAIASALIGTSTVVSYIESGAGVQAGGRTGLTACTTALCFLAALFLTPLILMIPAVAVAPALVVVGIAMFQSVTEIDLTQPEIAAPAVFTILLMPLSYSISTGIGVGLIAAAILALAVGRPRSLSVLGYALAVIFLLHFIGPALQRWW